MWVWGDDDNEKVTGPSRQKGDCGGGSHGEEGAPQAGKAPWEHRHVRGSTALLKRGNTRKRARGRGVGEPGGFCTPLHRYKDWVAHTLPSA